MPDFYADVYGMMYIACCVKLFCTDVTFEIVDLQETVLACTLCCFSFYCMHFNQ